MSMSLFQSINAENSQLPRLVVLRKSFRSGTFLIANSIGRVTVKTILLTGIWPASAMIFIFGNVISGKRETCILLYTKPPARKIITITTVSGLLCVLKNFIVTFAQSDRY